MPDLRESDKTSIGIGDALERNIVCLDRGDNVWPPVPEYCAAGTFDLLGSGALLC